MPYRIPGPQGTNPFEIPPQTCGPVGTNNDAGDPNGPFQKGPTPGPVGRNDEGSFQSLPPQIRVKPLVFDSDKVIPFLRSVAYSFVAQRNTRMEWKEDDSKFMKALYTVFFWKGTPGTVDVTTGDKMKIEKDTQTETARLIEIFAERCSRGPESAANWLLDMERLRDYNLKAVQEVFADAREINREITGDIGKTIVRLAAAKAAATVTVKIMGEVVPGAGKWIALGYDIITGTIDEVSQANQANAVAVTLASTTAQEGGKEALGDAAEWAVDKINGKPTADEFLQMKENMDKLDSKIRDQMERRAQRLLDQTGGMGKRNADSIKSLSAQIAKNQDKLNAVQKGVVKSAGKAVAAKAVGWAFLGFDIYKAIDEYEMTKKAALAD